MAARPVSAAVACFFSGLAGPAAAGIAEFLGRRAFIPVAYALFMVFVNFTAGAGVLGSLCSCGCSCLVLVGFLCCWFWHGVTMGTDYRTIISHMRIINLKDCFVLCPTTEMQEMKLPAGTAAPGKEKSHHP